MITYNALPYQPPSIDYWLGTDAFGGSMMVRLVGATWDTTLAVILTICIAGFIGTVVGAALALNRHPCLRSICETLVGFAYAAPLLLLVILMITVFGDRFWIFPSVGLLAWSGIALSAATSLERVIGSGFVRASCNLGVSPIRAYLRHGIVHAFPTIIRSCSVLGAQLFQLSVLLTFIGVGRGGLGALIKEGYQVYPSVWWTWLPATIVAGLILGITNWQAHKRT